MSKPFVYITRKLPESVIEAFESVFKIEMWPEEEVPVERGVLLEKVQHADALITMLSDQVNHEIFEKQTNLKVVANLAVGYDNIDLNAAKEAGVVVTNTPDVLTDTTADLTFGLLLATARRLMEAERYVKNNSWENWAPLLMAGQDVHHKTIGIVGMGRIGETVAKRATGFEMEILYHNRSRKREAEEKIGATYVGFEELLKRSDFVVCLAPLTEETKGMFNKEAFERMKSRAIFINASRGALVDEEALYDAIHQNVIAGAGLDVFKNEPISADHPLLTLEQVVATPHIGSASEETRKTMMTLCLDNIQHVLNGKEAKTPVGAG
ncbi:MULTISPECIES: 2-hydroxyacid dehydrogenase [Pontibacillus]|uniref:D-glycerate dehydrogenase n=1 Tax=Pontibacillus chungwhensis TaxID=265426 RepID=A0ABY8UYD3_9BACI|nr:MULTISPECIES: D-glycerate dehydrogenase [Pontibacillus]MCD5325157.1 D-glycerate dehydrogenase [Pontibacillus sp. HN14]WIF97405.1 D-glycerate dehydrogenase [Pontibacillus chungwhensis]